MEQMGRSIKFLGTQQAECTLLKVIYSFPSTYLRRVAPKLLGHTTVPVTKLLCCPDVSEGTVCQVSITVKILRWPQFGGFLCPR